MVYVAAPAPHVGKLRALASTPVPCEITPCILAASCFSARMMMITG